MTELLLALLLVPMTAAAWTWHGIDQPLPKTGSATLAAVAGFVAVGPAWSPWWEPALLFVLLWAAWRAGTARRWDNSLSMGRNPADGTLGECVVKHSLTMAEMMVPFGVAVGVGVMFVDILHRGPERTLVAVFFLPLAGLLLGPAHALGWWLRDRWLPKADPTRLGDVIGGIPLGLILAGVRVL